MKKLFCISLLLASTVCLANNSPGVFNEGGYLAAKAQAQMEGKLQFIEFVAKWCLPCKHMEQTTFKDPALRELLTNQFASSKVDIDDFDGFALKQSYNVRYLPTMIVINQNGDVVARYEEAMGPVELTAKLSELAARFPIRVPSPKQNNSIQLEEHEEVPEAIEVVEQPSKPAAPQQDPIKTIFVTDKTILQFGVFSSLTNAQTLYDKITQALPSSPEMKSIALDNGSLVYALQYGPFKQIDEAKEVQEELHLLGFDCIIKKLQ